MPIQVKTNKKASLFCVCVSVCVCLCVDVCLWMSVCVCVCRCGIPYMVKWLHSDLPVDVKGQALLAKAGRRKKKKDRQQDEKEGVWTLEQTKEEEEEEEAWSKPKGSGEHQHKHARLLLTVKMKQVNERNCNSRDRDRERKWVSVPVSVCALKSGAWRRIKRNGKVISLLRLSLLCICMLKRGEEGCRGPKRLLTCGPLAHLLQQVVKRKERNHLQLIPEGNPEGRGGGGGEKNCPWPME